MVMMTRLRSIGLLSILTFVGATYAADLSKWAASYDANTKTRFIPVELWTGGEWDGSRELRMIPANLSFGKRGEKRITGPVTYKRPSNGEVLLVYDRNNKGMRQGSGLDPI